MKRVELSSDELNEVIRLRQAGGSWVAIERKVPGVTRRVAQRAHNEWERSRSVGELESARRELAKDEQRRHSDAMLWIADGLVRHLTIDGQPVITSDAAQYMSRLWARSLPWKLLSDLEEGDTAEDDPRNRRRNEWLFQSLQEHTRKEVSWGSYEDWLENWDAIMKLTQSLHETTLRTVASKLRGGAKGGEDAVSEERADSLAANALGFTMAALWHGIRHDDLDSAVTPFAPIPNLGRGEDHEADDDRGSASQGKDSDENLRRVMAACRRSIPVVWVRDTAVELRDRVHRMRQAEEQLDVELDPLALRPVLLRTRCRLCPA